MNPQQPSSPGQTPTPAIHNPLEAMQKDEQVICEIKRHPIGLVGPYLMGGLSVLAIVGITIFGLPFIPDGTGQYSLKFWSTIIALLLVALALLYTYVATRIYSANRWIVTSDSVTQVNQVGLFGNQSSQLPLSSLEDITVNQYGILAHTFNYGTLVAQTAGEHSKFSFSYCPDPNKYAQLILNTRENMKSGSSE